MNVLSLFDGMSCGQIALERIGIKVDNYFASEIDKYAIKVTQNNYPNTIQLGDVTKVHYKNKDLIWNNGRNFKETKIDLLIAGSPCQGFSLAGKGLNFEDPRSKLFFDFVRLLKETSPKHFLLENVRMKKEYQDIISKYLGFEPIEINSRLLSAQNRSRLYWTNIKNITQPNDKNIVIKDIIENSFSSIYPNYLDLKFGEKQRKEMVKTYTSKASCLSASMYKGQISSYCKNEKGEIHKYSPIECEKLQTVPITYTSIVSNTQRYKMLGNGWTIDVIVHILKEIK